MHPRFISSKLKDRNLRWTTRCKRGALLRLPLQAPMTGSWKRYRGSSAMLERPHNLMVRTAILVYSYVSWGDGPISLQTQHFRYTSEMHIMHFLYFWTLWGVLTTPISEDGFSFTMIHVPCEVLQWWIRPRDLRSRCSHLARNVTLMFIST